MCRRPAQKGAGRRSTRALPGRLLNQDPSQDRSRRLSDRLPSDRRRSERQPQLRDAKTNREAARKRGICPVIPYRSNTIDKPKFFAKVLYKARARIEQMMGKIKRFKRIALRCEKTATNYASFLALVCGFILIKSVHTA